MRLNIDGANKNDSIVGYNGLLRDCIDEWLEGFVRYFGSCNAYIAELWGVLKWLKLAKEMNFWVIEIHIDSEVVVQNILDIGYGSIIGMWLVIIGQTGFGGAGLSNLLLVEYLCRCTCQQSVIYVLICWFMSEFMLKFLFFC